eukprot:593507-Rhodomonas_salina.1
MSGTDPACATTSDRSQVEAVCTERLLSTAALLHPGTPPPFFVLLPGAAELFSTWYLSTLLSTVAQYCWA